MKNNPKVCVIGAGCSGITAVKNLLQAGVQQVVCYEQNSQVGGNWIYTADESHSSVIETTHIISSKTMSEYADYPMPDHYPDYPSHRQVLAYFQDYANHFGLTPYIRFNTPVQQVTKVEGNRWRVDLKNGETDTFDYLLIANGHHNVPRLPQLPGTFEGEYLHSHSYRNNRRFEGKRVLIIGSGNSGCDCAVESSRVADYVAISIRKPHYIIPKFLLGKPTDVFNQTLSKLPGWMAELSRKVGLFLQVGRYTQYGLGQPDFKVTESHPTLNSELLYMIRHGKVTPHKGITRVEGKTVTFEGGVQEEFDTIIAATGYKITFPFFDTDFLDYSDSDRVPLYLRMFHPEHPSLMFIGLVQPQGAVWPLSDRQAQLAGNYIMGRWQLPNNLQQLAEKDSDYIDREFLAAKRHTIEVHYYPYLRQLQKQIPSNAPKWSDQLATVE